MTLSLCTSLQWPPNLFKFGCLAFGQPFTYLTNMNKPKDTNTSFISFIHDILPHLFLRHPH
ncbi:unnamed protein product [Musa textilis]